MNQKEKLEEATIKALQGKLTESISVEDNEDQVISLYDLGKNTDVVKNREQRENTEFKKVGGSMIAKDDPNSLLNESDDEDYDDDENDDYHIEVIDVGGDECPYISGYSDRDVTDIDIEDRYDLSEDELFVTGWAGIVQNEEDGPFKSFNDIEISCFDDEKDEEYDLPEIPDDIQEEFLQKVNKWIQDNMR